MVSLCMVGLQSNVELVAYFIQICVLHAHDKSQQTQNSDCVFIAILTVYFKKCFVYLFERCHNLIVRLYHCIPSGSRVKAM